LVVENFSFFISARPVFPADAPESAIYYCIVAAEIAVSGSTDGLGQSLQRMADLELAGGEIYLAGL
jgi:hypothetical protein